MRVSKYSTAVTNCEKNQGLHSAKAIKKAQDIVLYCADTYAEAHMYHMVVVGSQSVADYRWAYNTLADKMRDFGFKVEFFGALEYEEEKGGLHAHIFFIIECVNANPAGVKRTSKSGNTKVVKIMSTEKDSWLKKTLAKRGMSFHFAEPKNEVHRTKSGNMPLYARPTLKGGRLADCLIWSSYPFKVRSKASVPSREIYFFSEFDANKKKEIKENTNETSIATQYEAGSGSEAITASGSTEASRSTAMVGTGCESMEASASSAGSEEAKDQWRCRTGGTNTDYEEVNLAGLMGRFPFPPYRLPMGKGYETRELVNPAVWVYNCLTDVRRSYTPRPTA